MRGTSVIVLGIAGLIATFLPREASAQRGGFGGRVGSIRYAGGSSWDDDQAWNAGFGSTTPAWQTGRKDVATVSPSAGPGFSRSVTAQNRVDTVAPSPLNYGSIQNSTGLVRASDSRISSTGGNPVWLLVKMGSFLEDRQQLTLWITQTTERVNEAGQKIQVASRQITYVQHPDRLAVDITAADAHTRIVYDGTGVTTLDTTRNLIGKIPVQGSLDTVLDTLATRYGMAVPADDLLYKGAYGRLEKKIRSAQDLGVESVDGHPCYHAAFSGEAVDFEVWIQSQGDPMARRVIIHYKNTPARPRCILDLTRWETGPIPASVFNVDVPAGARQIQIMPRQ